MHVHMLYTYGEKFCIILLNIFHWKWRAALECVINSFAGRYNIYKTKVNPCVGGGVSLRTGKDK